MKVLSCVLLASSYLQNNQNIAYGFNVKGLSTLRQTHKPIFNTQLTRAVTSLGSFVNNDEINAEIDRTLFFNR
jgi:hypothetical protein